MNINDKKKVVEDLHERIGRSSVVFVTDYKGLDVVTVSALRRKLHEVGTEYAVVKNTLLIRAVEDTDASDLKTFFKGPTAVAICYDDPVAPAKALTEFADENDKLEIKAGLLSGKLMDLAGIKALADLPSREQLLGQLLGGLNAVPTDFVRVLSAVPGSLLNVLSAIKDQKEAA